MHYYAQRSISTTVLNANSSVHRAVPHIHEVSLIDNYDYITLKAHSKNTEGLLIFRHCSLGINAKTENANALKYIFCSTR